MKRESQRDALLDDAAKRARHYLHGLAERAVGATPEAVAGLRQLDEPLPLVPSDPHRVLAMLDDVVSPATLATAGPRFFGFVIGGSAPASLAASWLATAWDQNAALFAAQPGVSKLEEVALRWMLELFGLPSGCAGSFVTGATMANFTALAAARHRVLKNAGWDVEADGLFGAPPIQVVVSEEAHPTLIKALGLLGLGRARLTRAPVDTQGRIDATRMPRIVAPAIVCVQAGNINTGAFDPCEAIIPAAQAAGAWVHVDGAFGLWALASRELAPLAAGVPLADSWATDAHKWLNVPYDSGVAFVRDAEALPAAMAITAAYLPSTSAGRNPSDFTPELSRRARGTEIWMNLRTYGAQGVAEMIERNCRQARRFAAGLRAAGFEILNDVVLNQVLVSFGTPERTRAVVAGIQQDGTCWCGPTIWQGRTAMRISVCSWATSDEDVERSLEAMVRVAKPQR